MAINLSKGGNIDLSKEDPSLKKVLVALGWEERATDGQDFDLDSTVFMTDANNKCRSEGDFIYYRNKTSACGSVQHNGDNKVGGGGDSETVNVELDKVPAHIEKLRFPVTIHDGEARSQNFGQVSNAFIRLVNAETGVEIARYDLTEDASTNTAMIFGELYRNNGGWKFRAVGQGFDGGLAPLVRAHGLDA